MAAAATTRVGELPAVVQREIGAFSARLRRQQKHTSADVARQALKIMREVVTHTAVRDVSWLISSIKLTGQLLIAAQPHELVIGNMVRRVLHIVREEMQDSTLSREPSVPPAGGSGDAPAPPAASSMVMKGPSLMKMLDAVEAPDYSSQPAKDLKKPIHAAITELDEEISTAHEQIADQATEHIHANEVILTHGRDPTVETFLRAAHKKRPFEVVVAQTAPANEGHATAARLAEAGIATTLIADGAIFAMMARVNKVIVGAHAVMANGGLYASASCHLLAIAAQHHSVPLVVCAGLYKLAPLFPSGPEQYCQLLSPQPPGEP